MSLATIVLTVLALLLIGAVRIWARTRSEGHGLGGGLALAVFALPVLLITGRL